MLLAPTVIVLALVTILPTLHLLQVSFTPWNMTRPESRDFSGLANYRRILDDDRFWHSVGVQARLSVITVSMQVLVGLGVALLLNTRMRFAEVSRSLFLVPMVLPPVVVAIIWKILFTPDISVINWVLGLLHLPQPAWLGDPRLALWSIAIADIWEWFPFSMLILLAGLQMLPTEPLEASRIDGASYVQSLVHIVLPLLKPIILLVLVFRLIESMKAFPLIFIMTGGGPGIVTEPTNYYAYQEIFSYSNAGYASAISVVMLLITLVLSVMIIQVAGRQEVE